MTTLQKNARIAGALYLLLMLAPLRLIYIPTKLIVAGNAGATATNILNHQMLFRLGMVADILCGVILIFLTLAFYRVFKDVSQKLAVMVVIFGGIMPATIDFLNVLNDAATLLVLRAPEFSAVFSQPQRDAVAMLFLRMHHQEILAAETLWGVWLLPLAVLVYKSRFMPRFIGVWLVINGIAYIATSWTGLLAPRYEQMVSNYTFPALLGELALMLWLVTKGASLRAVDRAATVATT